MSNWVKKCTKKCNRYGICQGQGGPRPICNNFDSIIGADQETYPILPAQYRRSGNKHQYSCGWVYCNHILMDSTASIMLMFNKDLLDNISLLYDSKHISSGSGNFGAQ